MRVHAHAKVNLTLEVFGKRSDGYHALRSVVLPVSLCDTLEVEAADGFVCDTGYPDDLCLKAARVLCGNRVGVGARISVTKRIPVGGGLGGGSADAAATLQALNELWGGGLSREELADIGAQVGSDVPALVLGGSVLMEGRGEIVTRIAGGRELPPLHLVLVNPGVFSSTKEVYANCVPRPPDDSAGTSEMLAALATGDVRRIAAALTNDLQEPAMRLHPEIRDALDALKAAGAVGTLMSGSGSTVFGLVETEERGRDIAALLSEKGYWTQCVQSVGVEGNGCPAKS